MQQIMQFIGSLVRTAALGAVIVAGYMVLSATSWGAGMPRIVLADQTTPTTIAGQPTQTITPTQTATLTATPTLVPTMTPIPTATPYVVTQDAIMRSMRNEWQLTTQSMIVESHWNIDTSANRSSIDKLFNGTLTIEALATYEVRAGINLQDARIVVAPGNKITITLPAPTIETVTEDIDQRYITARKSGVIYTFSPDDQLEVSLTKQISTDTAQTARTKACQRGILTRAAQHASYVVRDLVSNINPLIRYQDITVVTTTGVCR
jgi:hypothetical protein